MAGHNEIKIAAEEKLVREQKIISWLPHCRIKQFSDIGLFFQGKLDRKEGEETPSLSQPMIDQLNLIAEALKNDLNARLIDENMHRKIEQRLCLLIEEAFTPVATPEQRQAQAEKVASIQEDLYEKFSYSKETKTQFSIAATMIAFTLAAVVGTTILCTFGAIMPLWATILVLLAPPLVSVWAGFAFKKQVPVAKFSIKDADNLFGNNNAEDKNNDNIAGILRNKGVFARLPANNTQHEAKRDNGDEKALLSNSATAEEEATDDCKPLSSTPT